ncbi:MAG: putative glycoside hydrolase [Oscillospiraceae bacterium]
MKQHQKKIKRYKSSFNGKAERGLLVKRIIGFIVLLAILFGLGWLLAKPGIELGSKLWHELKFGADNSTTVSSSAPKSPSSAVSSQSTAQDVSSAPVVAVQNGSKGKWAYVAISSVSTPESAQNTARALKADGFCAAVLELKDARGFIYYQSAIPIAQDSLSASTVDAAAVAKAFTDNGITPIASISAFKDASAPRTDKNIAVTYQDQKEFLWLNNKAEAGGVPWLNPYSDGAVTYITDILNEVLTAGFKEVILSGVQFPSGYGLELAGYNTGADTRTKDAVLKDCVTKWQTLCEENNAACWFEYSSVAALGEGDETTIANPFTFGAKNILLDFAASATKTDDITTLDSALFNAAVSKAAASSTVLSMRVSGGSLSGDALGAAANSALDAGFASACVR